MPSEENSISKLKEVLDVLKKKAVVECTYEFRSEGPSHNPKVTCLLTIRWEGYKTVQISVTTLGTKKKAQQEVSHKFMKHIPDLDESNIVEFVVEVNKLNQFCCSITSTDTNVFSSQICPKKKDARLDAEFLYYNYYFRNALLVFSEKPRNRDLEALEDNRNITENVRNE
eukprot:TRINITY_DN10495_c0_g1_i1.p1 TRINITY_DN10495_c0_g1~~TRINITY_DN10495_c0_g1_i1.p1  ORF type:complete len:170 (+),score=34.59 TRINITY_DN10495_c0_g1_i1:55-564(+)